MESRCYGFFSFWVIYKVKINSSRHSTENVTHDPLWRRESLAGWTVGGAKELLYRSCLVPLTCVTPGLRYTDSGNVVMPPRHKRRPPLHYIPSKMPHIITFKHPRRQILQCQHSARLHTARPSTYLQTGIPRPLIPVMAKEHGRWIWLTEKVRWLHKSLPSLK